MNLLQHVWPVIFVATLGGLAYNMRVMRGNLLDTLNAQYVETARAKGLSEGAVIMKHAVPNALHPLVTYQGVVLPYMLTGEIEVAIVFALADRRPGHRLLHVDRRRQRHGDLCSSSAPRSSSATSSPTCCSSRSIRVSGWGTTNEHAFASPAYRGSARPRAQPRRPASPPRSVATATASRCPRRRRMPASAPSRPRARATRASSGAASRKSVPGMIGFVMVATLLGVSLLADFFAPVNPHASGTAFAPPDRISWHVPDQGWRSHAGRLPDHRDRRAPDPVTFQPVIGPDFSNPRPIRLLVPGWDYRLFGLIPMSRRFIGLADGTPLHVLGTDKLGRDIFSRGIVGSRISLAIALSSIALITVVGTLTRLAVAEVAGDLRIAKDRRGRRQGRPRGASAGRAAPS